MSGFDERFRELTHEMEVVLDEDLASLQKMPVQHRIERYNSLKSSEQEFVWEFAKAHPRLTGEERDEVRSRFRLARLLLAASLYEEGELPPPLAEDFVEAELQAVVDFDRYRKFDVLDPDEIERKIRRMDGEVYELVTEYTSTQIANVDELMDHPDVQGDVLRKLLDRYEQRREKIRQGFFVYVETHGLEHMVERIEEAVRAVDEAATEREAVREAFREEMAALDDGVDPDLRRRTRAVDAELQSLARRAPELDAEELDAELERLDADELTETQAAVRDALGERIDRIEELERRLDRKIEELESVKEAAREGPGGAAGEETASVIADEIEQLREERDRLRTQIEGLRAEREGVDAARDRLEQRQADLEPGASASEAAGSGAAGPEASPGPPDDGDLPADAVDASMARLLELDYVGRVDTSLHDAAEIHTPDGPREIPDGYWDGRSERRNERTRLDRLLGAGDGPPERYPLNRGVRYEVAGSRLFGLGSRREMVVETVVRSNLDAHVRNGFDATPADLDDLLTVVNDAVFEAERGDYHYLLAVASPTGWSDRVREQIENDDLARTRYSRHLSLVLVDLSTGELIYDPTDEVAAQNRDLFSIPVDDERVRECVRTIRADYVEEAGVDSVLLEEVLDEGFAVHVARRAFDRLEEEGAGTQLRVEDYGLALSFD